MPKRDLNKMRRLYEELVHLDEKILELKEFKEELFETYWIEKSNFKNYKISYPNFLLTEDNLWQRDKEYIEKINDPEIVKKDYWLTS